MKYWLMKSEPSEFSIDDLKVAGVWLWDGVRNYQVRNMFRDQMQKGDIALFYHSSCAEIGVVGEMSIVVPCEVDPAQFDTKSKYFDPKSSKEKPRWFGPKVKFKKKFKRLVPLAEIKSHPAFATMPLVMRGNRLSAFPITPEQYTALVQLAT